MSNECHHRGREEGMQKESAPPIPGKQLPEWVDSLARAFGEDRDTRWGSRLVRLVSDMMLVCDENFKILYHNRAFLNGVGYQAGTFIGTSLLAFFSKADLPDAEYALGRLLSGRSAGMRFQSTFLTRKGKRQFDARVIRTRRAKDSFYLYFVIRDETNRSKEIELLESRMIEPLITGLPVAAFRTDHRLRIIQAYGDLWTGAFRCPPKSLIGVDLSQPVGGPASNILSQVDFCDTMAGLTLHTDFSHRDQGYVITVEPFLDEKSRIMGSIGMIRLAKEQASPIGGNRSTDPTCETLQDEIGLIRESIRPRKTSDDDFDLEGEQGDLLALSN